MSHDVLARHMLTEEQLLTFFSLFQVQFLTNIEFSSMQGFSQREMLKSSEPESVCQDRIK